MAVHDIDMDGVGAGLFDAFCFIGKVAKIRRQYRWFDLDRKSGHAKSPFNANLFFVYTRIATFRNSIFELLLQNSDTVGVLQMEIIISES